MPFDVRNYGDIPITVRPQREQAIPQSNMAFPRSFLAVDHIVAERFEQHQVDALPSYPDEFYQHPTAYSSTLRNRQEERYRNTVLELMNTHEDRTAFSKREDEFVTLRTDAAHDQDHWRRIMNFHYSASIVGHAGSMLAGAQVEAPYRLPMRLGMSLASSSLNNLVLNTRLQIVPFFTRPIHRSSNFRLIAERAMSALDRNAQAIVSNWGQYGRDHLINSTRNSNAHTLRYLDNVGNLHGTPSSLRQLLGKSGVSNASIALELSRIDEIRIVDSTAPR